VFGDLKKKLHSLERPSVFGQKQNGCGVPPPLTTRSRVLETFFVPTDEAGFEMEALC
jgi:hypothetical protein